VRVAEGCWRDRDRTGCRPQATPTSPVSAAGELYEVPAGLAHAFARVNTRVSRSRRTGIKEPHFACNGPGGRVAPLRGALPLARPLQPPLVGEAGRGWKCCRVEPRVGAAETHDERILPLGERSVAGAAGLGVFPPGHLGQLEKEADGVSHNAADARAVAAALDSSFLPSSRSRCAHAHSWTVVGRVVIPFRVFSPVISATGPLAHAERTTRACAGGGWPHAERCASRRRSNASTDVARATQSQTVQQCRHDFRFCFRFRVPVTLRSPRFASLCPIRSHVGCCDPVRAVSRSSRRGRGDDRWLVRQMRDVRRRRQRPCAV
jgi:hypothetical protein